MSARRMFCVLALLLSVTSIAGADTQDPAIIVRSGVNSGTIFLTPGNLTTTINFDTDPRCFQVMLPIPGTTTLVPSMTCTVVNMSGLALSSFTFTIVPAQLPLTVNDSAFGTWTVNPSFTVATFTFAQAIPTVGNAPNCGTGGVCPELQIDFIGFDPNAPDIGFTATPVPEPTTLGLLAIGLGGTFLRRKFVAPN